MSLSKVLDRLVTPGEYSSASSPKIRWGQLLRKDPDLAREEEGLLASEKLIRFAELGSIRGGVVTRANSYFSFARSF
jgi:hypothetical protein